LKITSVEAIAFRDVSDAGESLATLVEVHSDRRVSGVAILPGDLRCGVTHAGRLVIDEDPRGVLGLNRLLLDSLPPGRSDSSISALDVALWDLKAKLLGEPLWRALGASRPRVNAHAAGFDSTEPSDAFAARCSGAVDQWGFRAIKLQAGGTDEANLSRLEVLHDTLSGRTRQAALMIDLQEQLSAKDSVRLTRMLEERFDLTWVEEPAKSLDCAALRHVSDSVRAAVCAGAKLQAARDFLPHFRERSLDVVEINIANGGITAALEVADCAFGYELPVVLSAIPGNVHAHLGAALPYCMSLEIVEANAARIVFETGVEIVDGWAVAGDRPGLGLEVDRAALDRMTLGPRAIVDSRAPA
jgi:L-alanine-DL-glutamate epimerase-like enolase superfamily enzyme